MQVIFLAYANSQDAPLPLLGKEDDLIYKSLSGRMLQQHFLVHRDSFTTQSKIAEYLLQYRDQVSIFLFSGHAGRDKLLIEDETTRSEGIAHLLGQCPNLKLVILNGCSTQRQVNQLLANGIPIVIATSAPVEDEKAMQFSTQFFSALAQQANIKDAFELAIGKIMMNSTVKVHRSIVEEDIEEDGPLWGIYYKAEHEPTLSEQLPNQTYIVQPEQFKPNERLTQELWKILAPYSKKIRLQQMMEEEGDEIEDGDKHIAILNSLPRPLAEHLRKLMAPVDAEKQGYDKLSLARLQQMVTCFETTIEFICYILLSQLWELKQAEDNIAIPPEVLSGIEDFLQLDATKKVKYNYTALIKDLGNLLHAKPLFVEELKNIVSIIEENETFKEAYTFMHILRRKLQSDMVGPYEVSALCIRAEESLIELFHQFGFLARYTLAAVKHIDVLRYRHVKETTFSHSIVKLMRVFGKLQEEQLSMNRFLFNRSVLLLKKEPKADDNSYQELSLSPFIIDENAFDLKTDLSKLYFFSHYKKNIDAYCFKHINRPGDPMLEISEGKYELIKTQFDVFKKLLWP
jgi:hypothetical protein